MHIYKYFHQQQMEPDRETRTKGQNVHRRHAAIVTTHTQTHTPVSSHSTYRTQKSYAVFVCRAKPVIVKCS